MVQLSHPYMTTGKTIDLTRWTFVSEVISLLLNMLSRFVIVFLARSKRLLISWLQSPSAVILETKKIKSVTVSIVSRPICQEVIGQDAMIFVFWMLSFKPDFSFNIFYFIFKLYNIVLVLPYINMNPPQVYTCSPSWTLLPPPSLYYPSGSSQCTSPKHPVLCIEPGLATRFIYDIIHVSMPFSQIIPPSPYF